MLTIKENTRDNTQALFDRLQEVEHIVRGLARIILPRYGEYRSVWEITNRVFDQYYQRAKAA
jgi:hypothetical protein